MVTTQPEALRLADASDNSGFYRAPQEIERAMAAELRRQHALIAELVEALEETVPMLEALLMIQSDPEPGSIGHKARAALSKAKEQ